MVTRSIGRLDRLSSPNISASKSWPAKTPEIKRIDVPELPISSLFFGACRPSNPTPCILTRFPSSSICTPKSRKTCMVDSTSSPRRMSRTVVTPLAKLPKIMERWLTDLSPGTRIRPFRPFTLVDNFIGDLVLSFVASYFIIKRPEILKISGIRAEAKRIQVFSPDSSFLLAYLSKSCTGSKIIRSMSAR